MFRQNATKGAPRLVWRITQANPQGVFVQASGRGAEDPLLPDPSERGFVPSSLDLLFGVDVSEAPLDTLPGELIDAFTTPEKKV